MTGPSLICIIGAESTGKTTLARALANQFDCPWVPEYLREFCDAQRRTPTRDEQALILETQHGAVCTAQLGAARPTETVIIDGLDPNWVTVMRYSDYAWREVPEAWLQRDYLPRFRPE